MHLATHLATHLADSLAEKVEIALQTQGINQYDAPHQFEPLLPSEPAMRPLPGRASDVARAATALGASAVAHTELRGLLRSMNSYYTNRIEGEDTRPVDIERALQQDFPSNADLARRQRSAVAHIQTEVVCESELAVRAAAGQDLVRDLYEPAALTWLRGQLFEGLPAKDLHLSDGGFMAPGAWRLAHKGRCSGPA
jgi:hypothetical protein